MMKLSKSQIILASLFASIILGAAAFYYYSVEKSAIHTEKYEYLKAIASLKIDQIEKWRDERTSEAKFFPTVGKFIKSTIFLKENINDREAREFLTETLLPIKQQHSYKNFLITDLSGNILFSLDTEHVEIDSITIFNSKHSIDRDSVFFSDFYFCELHSEIHLDIYSPIKDNSKNIIAVFILQIDPRDYLFPMIQKWPTPSKTAETLVYRDEKTRVRLLTEAKFLKNDNLNYTVSANNKEYVSVKGINDNTGVVDGVDYKNSEVIAAISRIKGTDWYLVSKVNKREIYEELFFKGWAIIVLVVISLLLIFVTALYLFRLRQSQVYKSLFFKERELYETQEGYRTTLYSIGDAIITTDSHGFIKNMNSVAEKLTGWNETEAFGKKLKQVFKVINEDTNEEVEDPVVKVLKSNTIVGLANHTMLIRKDGKRIPISDSGSPIKDEKGNIIGVVLVFRDQTEERAKERAILESNDKFTKIFNSSSESISLTQMSSGKLKEINEGFIQMFGYSRDEVIDRTTIELGLWAFPSDREKMIEEIKATGSTKNFEATGRRKNQELFTALISGELVIIDNEQMLLLTIRDITDRKKLEAALKNEKERISAILNLVGDPIFVKDNQHRFTLGNKAFFEMIGLDEENVIGKTLAEDIPEDEMKHFLKVDRLVLDTGITDTREEELTINNQKRTIITSKTSFTDDGGNKLLIGSIHDITDRVNAEKEKTHLNDLMKYIISNTKSSVSVFDTKMNYIYVSDRYFDDFHIADKNIIGRNHYDVFPDLPQFLRDIHKRALNGETLSGEGDPFVHSDGSMDWANWTCIPWFNTDETIGGIIVYVEIITDRKKFDETLKANEEKYRRMTLNSPMGMHFYELKENNDLVFTGSNPAADKLLGIDHTEFIGKTIEHAFPNLVNTEVPDRYRAVASEGVLWNNEQISYKDEKIAGAFQVIAYQTKPNQMVALFADITDRKLFEETLKASEEKYKMLLNFASDAFFQGDNQGNFITVNNKAIELTGYSKDELTKMNMKDLFPKSILENKPLRYDKLIAGETVKTERKLLRKDQKEIFVEMTSKQMPDGTYQSFIRDISEQKAAEKELIDSEEKFRMAFTTSPDSININRLSDGVYISINRGFTTLTGYTEEDVIGKSSLEINIWADAEDRKKLIKELAEKGKVDNLEANFRLKNGEVKTGLMSASLLEVNGEKHILSITKDISERKKAQDIIKSSEASLNALINNSTSSIWSIDCNYNYVSFNNNFYLDYLKAYGKELVKGANVYTLITPELKEFWKPKYDTALSGERITFEFQEKVENRLRFFEVYLNPIIVDNKITGVSALSVDITDRRNAEANLRKLSSAIEQSPVIVFVTNIDGNIEYVNPKFEEITGYKLREVIGKNPSFLNSNFQEKEVYEELWSTILSGKAWSGELYNKKKNGELFWQESQISPIFDNSGKIVNFVSVGEDITERKRLITEIIGSEEKFRSIWENSVDAMRLVDENGIILNVNDSYCNLFGLKKEELIGKLFNVSYVITDVNTSLDLFKERFKSKTILKNFETEILKKDGNKIWIELTNSFIEFEDSVSLLSIIRDITDRKNMITEMTQAKEKAEEMNKLKSYFFANMSHELRTPFVGILGFAEILKDTLKVPEEREYADQILRSSKRLTETLNKILNVTRIEFDKVEVNYKEIKIYTMLKSIEAFYSSTAKLNNTKITTICDDQDLILYSDPKLVEDILNNLVSNAIKFTRNGSISLEAKTKIIEEKNYLSIKISDTGIGIPKEKQSIVWQEFRQASEGMNRSFEGTGLGLTITKKYVELLKGNISLESEEGKGSIFTINFPVIHHLNTGSSVESIIAEKKKNVSITERSSRPRVLYVEDDVVALQFIGIVLKSLYIVDTAFKADTALDLVAKNNYDVLMLDINLGRGMDGVELMNRIRQFENYKDVPIVAVTAYAAQSDKTEFLAKGFNEYISKPFTSAALKELLTKILNY